MTLNIVLNLMTVFMVLFGTFFMFVAALGLCRLPDFYHRMHAATKSVTLGITGLLIAAAITLARQPDANVVHILTKVSLIIIFQFVANPVGAHMLAKAAKLDCVAVWEGTLGDDSAKAE